MVHLMELGGLGVFLFEVFQDLLKISEAFAQFLGGDIEFADRDFWRIHGVNEIGQKRRSKVIVRAAHWENG